MQRRKTATAISEFRKLNERLLRLDQKSHTLLTQSSTRPELERFTISQLRVISEGIFLAAYRDFENLCREIFLLQCLGKPDLTGRQATCYLSPKNWNHAERLIRGNQRFVDWSTSESLIQRCDLFFENNTRFRDAIVSNKSILDEVRFVRNYISHGNDESLEKFNRAVLKEHFKTLPPQIIYGGEFLLLRNRFDNTDLYLRYYLGQLAFIASALA